ncbi:NAC domain-containing protein 68-like [Magnolia sinica]|uniref:NAC domain-containing protein 68-like n=1 Tax=Magnolia sinica TaxID=86752 RepID=UPI002658DBA6|nr:NAC domain-containing protein 68-like [Magnolia sinica]
MESRLASEGRMEEEWKLSIPIGIKFRPNDVEMIDYLFRKVYRMPIYPGIVAEANVYDYDPADLRDISFDHGDGVFYFFTPTYRRCRGGNRPNRKAAGRGYWKANGSEQPIKDSCNKVVGGKRMLVFFYDKPCDKDIKKSKTKWIMYEYKLPTDINPFIHYNEGIEMLDTMVLCKIYRKKESTLHQRQQEGKQQHQQEQEQQQQQQERVQAPAPSMTVLPPNSELDNDNFFLYCEELPPLLPLWA